MHKKKRRIKKSIRKLLIILLVIVFLGVGSGLTPIVKTFINNPKSVSHSTLQHVSDNNTMDSYTDFLLSDESGTRNSGRIWSDKTVSVNDISLDNNSDGYTGTVKNNSDFLNVFSTLGSSQVVNEYPPNPIDLVIALDVSSSMDSGDDSNSRMSLLVKSADSMMTKVLSLNKNNRVALILFDDNGYTFVPLNHYEIANEGVGYVEGEGFTDHNPGSGIGMGTVVKDSDGNEIAYHSSKHQKTDDIKYNFLAIEKGYPDISGSTSPVDWGEEGAIYRASDTSYGNGRNIIFKYKKDLNQDDSYNKDKYDGEEKDGFDNDDKTVTLLSRTQGGTCIQCGYWLGLKTLADADNTPVSYELSTGEEVTRDRLPVFVMVSDGASNSASDYSTWWAPGTIGEDTKNTFSSTDSSRTGNTNSEKYNEFNNWFGEQYNSDTLRSLKPIMTAAYWKKLVQKAYKRELQFYTIGVGLHHIREKIAVNPSGYLAKSSDIDDDMDEEDIKTADNTYTIVSEYIAGKNPRYISYETSSEHYLDDYTFFHPGNLNTAKEASAYGEVTEEYDHNTEEYPSKPQRAANVDRSKANYFYRRYSVLSNTGPDVTIMDVDNKQIDNPDAEYLGRMYYGNSKIASLEEQGYIRLNNIMGDYIPAQKRNAANPYIGTEYDKRTREDYAQYDLKTLDDLKVNDRYFDIDDESINDVFVEIYELIQGTIFEPIKGENDAGISDSVTYTDPIGLYMNVKDKAVSFDNSNYDMSLLMFGQMHGITKTAVYDFQFNDKFMELNYPDEQLKEPMKPGWYSSSDPEKAIYLGTVGGSWEAGDIYYLDFKTAIEFLPSLSNNGIETPDQLPEDQKHIKYTFYRFSENTDYRGQLRWNPCYGKTPSELQEGNKGVYKLSDIRIWVEDSGNYRGGTQGTIDLGYDMVLNVNLPINALPLQVATITMNENGIQSYETNLDDKTQSTPFRLFYGTELQNEIMTEDGNDVDIAKISPEYLNKNISNNNVYFYSNYYSATNYEGYITDTRAERTRGDSHVTFSTNSKNRYYIFQKPLLLYETIDGDVLDENGGYKTVKFTNDVDKQAFISTHNTLTKAEQFSSEKWYWIINDYYVDGHTKPVYEAIARKGAEFGEGIGSGDIKNGDYLTWYNPVTKEQNPFVATASKQDANWVIATRTGGLKVGDMAQSRKAKAQNVTNTASNYYLPTVSYNTTIDQTDESFEHIIINDYLGNNGRITVEDTSLHVGKKIEVSGEPLDETYHNEEFNFDLYAEGYEGEHTVIKMLKNPYTGECQLRVYTIDAITDNDYLLLDLNNNLATYNKNGQEYYVYVGKNQITSDSSSDTYRVYTNPDGEDYEKLTNSGTTIYVEDPNAIDNSLTDELNKYAKSDAEHNIGSIDYWIKNVILIPKQDYADGDWKDKLDTYLKEQEFVISQVDSTKQGINQYSSIYATKTSYLTTNFYFGYSNSNKPSTKPETWPQDAWDNQKEFTSSFKIKEGEGILIVGMKSGTDYKLTENITEAQKAQKFSFNRIEYKGLNESAVKIDNATISGHTESGRTSDIHYVNKMTVLKLSNLNISKTVKGANGEKDKDWTFNIKLTPNDGNEISSSYEYDTSSIDGVDPKEAGSITFNKDNSSNSYNGTITLKHGQSIKIKGIPQGTSYEVTEVDANLNDYQTKATNNQGELIADEVNVNFENTKYSRHKLKISKTVTGQAGEKDKDWTFKIVLTPAADVNFDDSYPYIGGHHIDGVSDSQDGIINFTKDDDGNYVGTIKLKHGQNITINNIPERTKYKIGENSANMNGYITTFTGVNSGTLSKELEEIHFTNKKPAKYDLTIDKTVIGGAGDTNKNWTFNITFTPEDDISFDNSWPYVGGSISGVSAPSDSDMPLTKNADGTYTGKITLKHGQSITFKELPENTQYKISEVDANSNGYITKVEGNTEGTITNQNVEIHYTNKKPSKHDLTISKEVQGGAGEKDKLFNFEIKFTPESDITLNSSYSYIGSSINGIVAPTNGNISLTKNIDGTYTGRIALKHGQSITIKDLPENTQYNVSEQVDSNDGYSISTSDNTNGILNGKTPIVKFINTKLSRHNLTISKEVQGGAGDKNKNWSFLITLKPNDGVVLDNSYSYIGGNTQDGVAAKEAGNLTLTPGENGEYSGTVTLKHGQNLTINNLPEGTSYRVEEVKDNDDYVIVTNVTPSGTLNNINNSASIMFINKKPAKYDLTISKEVQGGAGEKDKLFNFEITLTPDEYIDLGENYLYDGTSTGLLVLTKQLDGTYKGNIKLKHNDTITIRNLPEKTQYKIEEVEANQNGYTTKVEGLANSILQTENTKVKFINTKLSKHNLIIKKIVTGNLGEKDKDWQFKINFKNSLNLQSSYQYLNQDNEEGTINLIKQEDNSYEATISLKDGQMINIKDLPEGTSYQVEEVEANLDGYETSSTNNLEGILTEETTTVVFYNKKYSKHSLTIEKILKGSGTDGTKEWNFEIRLKPSKDINFNTLYTYTGINIDNGILEFEKQDDVYVGTIKLRGGQKIIITDIPYDTEYEVKEIDENKDKYKTTYQNEKGIIQDNVVATITNEREAEVPLTFDIIIKNLGLLIISAGLLIGSIYIYKYKIKKI